MQNICIEYPHQPLKRRKELSDSVFGIFEHFWKTKEYNVLVASNVVGQSGERKG